VKNYARCIALGEVWEDTFPLRGADGEYRWFLSRAIPIRGADGCVLRWFGTNTDITAQRDAEEALRLADRRKDEFLAMLAHELRNPLAPISNSLHILRMAEGVDPAVEKVYEILERQTHHLARLVDDLLEVSRITQGKIVLRKQQVELAAVVRSALETSRPFIDAGGLQMAITLPSEPVLLFADPTRLSQAVANLLTNAAKYTPSGGQIWLTAEANDGDAFIRVRDNGIGISPELIPHIFEKFAQGSGSDARNGGGGLGIGLTLARNMVELHGGAIEAHSDGPGQGSQFTIQLPIGTGAPEPPEAGRGSQIAVAHDKRQRRVLIVDDARDSAFILSRLLEMLGHKVFTADNGADAIEIARSERPDVVFSDIAMAHMDGIELARRLRKEPGLEAMLLIALTGFGQDSDRALTRDAGFDVHLVKPISPEQIEQALGAVGNANHASAD
jgi:signal transduction histidine kinase/ActR/RegA family two-component response regulator